MNYKEKYNLWLSSNVIDQETKNELKNLTEDELEKRFFKELEFGTAGLRGIIGAGSNYMNIYTVGKTTQGIANYVNKNTSGTEPTFNKHLFDTNIYVCYYVLIGDDNYGKAY